MFSFKPSIVLPIALVLVGLSLAFGSAAAHADGAPGSKISWTVRTALSKYGSDRPKFTYTAKPGEQLSDGIVIANEGSAKMTLKLYAADGFTTGSGGFDILTPEKKSTGIGAWVKPEVAQVTVAAGKQVQIPFTMTVPAGATPGDHLGGIVTVLDQRDASGSGTIIHRRVGLRIETRVSGKVTSQLKIENLKVDYDGVNPFGTGNATIDYAVHNTGNTALSGLQKAKVSGGLGLSSRTVDLARLPDLLPGETWHTKASVRDVRAMLWVSTEVTVTPVTTDAAGSSSTLPPITASSRSVVSAWSVVFLVGFLIALVLLVWLVRGAVDRRRRSSQAKVDAAVAAAVDDALQKEKART